MPRPLSTNDDTGYPPTLPVLAGSLIAGVAIFLVVTIVIRLPRASLFEHEWTKLDEPLVVIALGFAAAFVVASLIVPGILDARTRAARKAGDQADAGSTFQTRTIIRYAIIEGGAFLNLVVFLVEGHPLNLAMGGLLLGLMIAFFPSRERFSAWLESQRGDWY